MKTINILFLGGAKRVGVARLFKQSGSQLGYQVNVFSYELSESVPIANEGKVFVGLRFTDQNVVQDIRKVVLDNNINVVLAFHDSAVALLEKLADIAFAPNMGELLIQSFSSKINSVELFDSYGVPRPPFSTEPPLIAKPNFGSASKGLVFMRTAEEVDNFFSSQNSNDFEIQRLIDGPEFSIDGYKALNSSSQYFVPRERIEISGGEVMVSKTVNLEGLNNLAKKVIEIPGFSGPFTIQVIQDSATGEFYCMEINPRFGGGLPVSAMAGVPWAELVLRDYLCLEWPHISHHPNYLVARSYREHGFPMGE